MAKLTKFPCKNERTGCSLKFDFSGMKSHEDGCKYRHFVCPMSELDECGWFGLVCDFYQHCKKTHADNIVQNPFKREYDVTKPNSSTFIIVAFNILFIVFTKVCFTTWKLYHCVHLVNSKVNGENYNFNLVISNKSSKVIRKGDIELLRHLEENSVTLDINGLVTVLGGFKSSSFEITVNGEFTCSKCKYPILHEFPYKTINSCLCIACAPPRHLCKRRDCSYKNNYQKYLIHKKYYCTYNRHCYICRQTYHISHMRHFIEEHSNIIDTYNPSCLYQVSNTEKFVLINRTGPVNGLLHCAYIFKDSVFKFVVRSPIPCEKLPNCTFSMKLENRNNNFDEIILKSDTAKMSSSLVDWEITIDRNTFLTKYTTNNTFKMTCKLIELFKAENITST